jgi:hypothetical protein
MRESIFTANESYRIFLFTSKLTRCLEIDPQEGEVALVVLACIFHSIDMKRYSESVNRQNNALSFAVNVDLATAFSSDQLISS